jgi:tRNA (mo5U34)-methyltransferase
MASALADRVGALPWYHTIPLPGGVVTPGYFDTAAMLANVPLPDSLAGKRCLDIGTCDGFWAFEMERRGADEVVAIDLAHPHDRDWPAIAEKPTDEDPDRAGKCFALAANELGSQVDRVTLSAYDLSPEEVGRFDFAFIGNLLLHLRDPIGALMAARSVVDGELLSVDVVSELPLGRLAAATLSDRPVPYWWVPSPAAYRLYFERAGFRPLRQGKTFRAPFGGGFPTPRPSIATLARSPSQAYFWARVRRRGARTSWVLAAPG